MTTGLGRLIVVVTLVASTLPTAVPVRGEGVGTVQTVAKVDLDRYLGQWFEVARFPNRFQRQCEGDVMARYARRPDRRLDVVNTCRTSGGAMDSAAGVARVVDPQTSAKLKVRFAPAALSFLPMVWGDYWVIGLASDYSWAVVGSPDRNYLWVLSRTPGLGTDAMVAAMQAVRENGFDANKLVATRHAAGSGVQP